MGLVEVGKKRVKIEKDWNFLLMLVEIDWSELKWVEVRRNWLKLFKV